MDFTGKRILVTGGTRGIGRGAVEGFLSRGARVAVNGHSAETTARAIDELDGGDRIIAAPGDVATADGCRNMVEGAVTALGGLDVLVSNAGVYAIGDMGTVDEETYDRVMDVNVKGTFFCSQAALPALKDSKGSIVNLGSTAGLAGSSRTVAYCASKGAIVNLTRALALELAPDIRVNSICPGVVDTEMGMMNLELAGSMEAMKAWYPLRRIAGVDETTFAILYLASEHAAFMTGVNLPLDGGTLAGGG